MRKLLMVLAGACVLSAGMRAETAADKAWKMLEAGAKQESTDHRMHAILALGILTGNTKAREMAEHALKDPKPAVRAAAAAALGDMHATESASQLRAALDDREIQVVLAAANSLNQLQDQAAYDIYYAVLMGKRKSSEGLVSSQIKELENPKNDIMMGLGFVPFGGIGLSLYQIIGNDRGAQVRAKAVEVLASDPDPKSKDALIKAASDKNWGVRVAALRAIARRGDASLSPTAEKAMADSKPGVSCTAAATIVHLAQVRR